MDKLKKCQACGGDNLEWNLININNSGVVNGRLSINDITPIFFLSCLYCSETLETLNPEQIISKQEALEQSLREMVGYAQFFLESIEGYGGTGVEVREAINKAKDLINE